MTSVAGCGILFSSAVYARWVVCQELYLAGAVGWRSFVSHLWK